MYVFTNTSANQMTFGDLTLAPNATTEFPDDRVAALSPHNLKALNDFANGNPLILKVEYQASVPPVTIGPVSAAPAISTPFGNKLMQAADADAAKELLGEGQGSGYTLPVATGSVLGGVKIGAGLSATADGTLSRNALVAGDIPDLDAAKIASGTLAVARLGTGTPSAANVLLGSGAFGVPPTATKATALATGRTFTLSGGASGTTASPFDGSANATLNVTLATPTSALRGGVLQQAAIADLTAAPTQQDFNALLAALRAASVIAS